MDRLLISVEMSSNNFSQICTATQLFFYRAKESKCF